MSTDTERRELSALLARVGGGDRAAFSEVYRRTSAKLFGICLRILKDEAEAEDALQDVYVNIWRQAGRFDASRASPITWLAALARNRTIDRLRMGRVLRESKPMEGVDPPEDAPSPLDQAEASDERRRLEECLSTLEQRHADVIRRAFFGGLTYDELAQAEGMPLGTVKSWIRRSLMKLRSCLER